MIGIFVIMVSIDALILYLLGGDIIIEVNQKEILQIKYDNLYHDLINQDDINVIKWIVMTILNLSYEEVHKKCVVKNSEITKVSKSDRKKCVEFGADNEDTTAINSNEWSNDYQTVLQSTGKTNFMGIIIDENTNKPVRGFLCGVESNVPFCFEVGNTSLVESSRSLLRTIYGDSACAANSSSCTGTTSSSAIYNDASGEVTDIQMTNYCDSEFGHLMCQG